ncbi:MAG: chromosomal replication initiator protein DnaA [Actinomycetota bacterium]|nr:chromosomal replication initiator protein DnaA [Actinomycetota bacterium]
MTLPAHLELIDVWREISAELRRVVGDSPYEIWLAPLQAKAWDGNVLLLQAPAPTQVWVATRFGQILERCARTVAGPSSKVVFAAGGGVAGNASPASSHKQTIAGRVQQEVDLNPRYSFAQFIIGKGNQLAHSAALAVSELPGQAYNPLFLHAPPGLGKTHLLHAIGNYLNAYGSGANVRYTTVEAFTNQFISALSTHSLDGFKSAYRSADALLIDDVQFLESKVKTEEEFFHTFNALYETGRQLVLTCDRLPRQLVAVEERLRERFESGLVADILPPDFATRLTILRKRAAVDGIVVGDPAVLELIAECISTNIRALEGALIRIVAYSSLAGRPIDLELARSVIDSRNPDTDERATSIAVIQATVAAYYELTVGELVSSGRAVRIAWPRQVAIYLVRAHTDSSLQAIGGSFGGRNHATVLHACKKVSQRLAGSSSLKAEIDDLDEKLRVHHDDRST